MRIFLTGAGGFVGSHILSHFLKNTEYEMICVCSWKHRGAPFRILDDENYQKNKTRVKIITHDLVSPFTEDTKELIGSPDIIINIASESHVDRSITDPVSFIKNNVDLMLTMLEFAREVNPKLFLQFSCYDEQTRAVTKDGLKYYSELTAKDEVLTLNDNREPEFQKIQKVVVQDYDGEMVKFGGIADLLVTPNHRMYDKDMNVLEAGRVKGRFDFPPSVGITNDEIGFIKVGDANLSANYFLYVLGMFIGDGFTAYQEKKVLNKSGFTRLEYLKQRDVRGRFAKIRVRGNQEFVVSKSYRIFFDVPEKDKGRKRLEKSLSALGLVWSAHKGKAGEHLYFSSKSLLEFFDRQVGKGAKNKRIPYFVWSLGRGNLQALYDGLIDSDGYYGKSHCSYTTVSKKLASDVVLLSFLLGKRVSSGYKYSEGVFQGRTIKGGAEQLTITGGRLATKQITSRRYRGKIWCITVKNKNFLVERNGKYMFSGNTDEIYGQAPLGINHKEWSPIIPSNPYSASKAAQEAIAISYWRTYRVPVIITNTMNVFGERQDKEKFIQLVIDKVRKEEEITIHSYPDGKTAGSRFYIHARNVADAILHIITNVKPVMYPEADRPERFNVVGEKEVDNLSLAKLIATYIGKDLIYKMVDFHSSRPGHDCRYALDGEKLAKIGWKPKVNFEESLKRTLTYSQHPCENNVDFSLDSDRCKPSN